MVGVVFVENLKVFASMHRDMLSVMCIDLIVSLVCSMKFVYSFSNLYFV